MSIKLLFMLPFLHLPSSRHRVVPLGVISILISNKHVVGTNRFYPCIMYLSCGYCNFPQFDTGLKLFDSPRLSRSSLCSRLPENYNFAFPYLMRAPCPCRAAVGRCGVAWHCQRRRAGRGRGAETCGVPRDLLLLGRATSDRDGRSSAQLDHSRPYGRTCVCGRPWQCDLTLCNKQMLVGGDLLLRDFGSYGILFMGACAGCSHCHSIAVNWFWALCDVCLPSFVTDRLLVIFMMKPGRH